MVNFVCFTTSSGLTYLGSVCTVLVATYTANRIVQKISFFTIAIVTGPPKFCFCGGALCAHAHCTLGNPTLCLQLYLMYGAEVYWVRGMVRTASASLSVFREKAALFMFLILPSVTHFRHSPLHL